MRRKVKKRAWFISYFLPYLVERMQVQEAKCLGFLLGPLKISPLKYTWNFISYLLTHSTSKHVCWFEPWWERDFLYSAFLHLLVLGCFQRLWEKKKKSILNKQNHEDQHPCASRSSQCTLVHSVSGNISGSPGLRYRPCISPYLPWSLKHRRHLQVTKKTQIFI